MSVSKVEPLIVGGGQAGLATSAHPGRLGRPHLVPERHQIAERIAAPTRCGVAVRKVREAADGPTAHPAEAG